MPFYFLARLLFHVTKDTNVQTTDVGNIYYLSKERAFPGIKAAQSSDAVPRIGGLKISLFIMGANQISAAVCLQAKGNVWRDRPRNQNHHRTDHETNARALFPHERTAAQSQSIETQNENSPKILTTHNQTQTKTR